MLGHPKSARQEDLWRTAPPFSMRRLPSFTTSPTTTITRRPLPMAPPSSTSGAPARSSRTRFGKSSPLVAQYLFLLLVSASAVGGGWYIGWQLRNRKEAADRVDLLFEYLRQRLPA